VAELHGKLWEFNLAKVVIVDVTDDYRLMQPPMPSDFYPIISELWLPKHNLSTHVTSDDFVKGYLYDWHERPTNECGDWYVGVVKADLIQEPAFRALFAGTS
jgi:hypothetical protein